MREVIIPKIQGDSLTAQLLSLYGAFKNSIASESLTFNFRDISWTCPLLLLPLSAYINTTNSGFIIEDGHKNKSYLEAINFPQGVNSVSQFEQQIHKHKTYIPISMLKKQAGAERERLESQFASMISRSLREYPGVKDAIYYPISELVANIFDHSKEQVGYLFGQQYPTKQYLDVCIVDTGRGLTAGYKEEKGLDLSDAEAIKATMRGNSTKPDQERGYGVRTSKRVVCEGLGGGFILISGSVALIAESNAEKLVKLPNFYWKGVVIAYRIPEPTRPLVISDYLE